MYMIVGVDEVGRGCWAGPLCVGAVALGESTTTYRDSKLLSAKQRVKLGHRIKEEAAGIGIGWASAKFIDEYGISEALKLAAAAAVGQIYIPYEEIIIDGTVKLIDDPRVTTLIKADQLINAVSAASIVAKVARDNYMRAVDRYFAGYGFAKHVGYGTKVHKYAIDQLGPCAIHRMSFSPLKTIEPVTHTSAKATTLTSGKHAEDTATDYLQRQGFTIVTRNWKTKWCEVDIIAANGKNVHFVEVKYRKTPVAGRGLEYITKQKLSQMQFAAELWFSKYGKETAQPHLSAIEVSGSYFTVSSWVPSIAAQRPTA